jgi:hypothetical protein
MKLSQKASIISILAIVLGLIFRLPSLAQEEVFFDETQHWVRGEFIRYFKSHGGLEVFGYPISEEFVDQGLTVQYFQKARMEWHPYNPDRYKVQLGLLGDELNYRQPRVDQPTSRSRRKVYFAQTGHTVSYAFLDYFNDHGGIDTFGYPITEMHFEDGQVVQYFQRMKLEWHPEDATSNVRIGELGSLYVSLYRDRMPAWVLRPANDARVSQPQEPPITVTAPADITALRAVVSLRYSVMSKKRTQTVTVHVTDDSGIAVPNASIAISFFESATGNELTGISANALTDDGGYAIFEVPVNEGRSGTQIVVRARVEYGNLSETGQNVFLLWW